MRRVEAIMGLPIMLDLPRVEADSPIWDKVFSYLSHVDETFSPYRPGSEVSRLNRGERTEAQCAEEVQEVLQLCREATEKTDGYFDIHRGGQIDPSGLVKGWALQKALNLLEQHRVADYLIDGGGDLQARGLNRDGRPWVAGIRHPEQRDAIIKRIELGGQAMATSGTYERGLHVYNPHTNEPVSEVVSLTVIGPSVLETDLYATAALAMGRAGIDFIENLEGFEGYMIEENMRGTMTSNFERYVLEQEGVS